MRIYSIDFKGVWPVGSCLIIAASSKEEALSIAEKKIDWQPLSINDVNEIDISKPCVIEFLSGDY